MAQAVLHYLNDRWVTEPDLVVPAQDISILRGYGVFDFLRTYHHKPFKLKEHLARLAHSAKLVGLTLPMPISRIEDLVWEGLQKNKETYQDFNIRLVITGGLSQDSVTPGRSTFIIIFTPAVEYPTNFYEKGVKVTTFETMRQLTAAKSTNYLMGVIALQEARQVGGVEAIFTSGGQVYEGTTSNIFFGKGNLLITPNFDILPGITRNVVLELARKAGIAVEERPVPVAELPSCDEAFITASNKEVMPVVQIDDLKVGDGSVGPLSKQLIDCYRDLIRDSSK